MIYILCPLLCCNRYFITVASTIKLEYGCPHRSSESLPVSNPIIRFEDLDADQCENLFAKMHELTKEINSKFKKLLNKVYESLRARHVDHSSIVLTLTKDDVMIFDRNDKLDKATNMFDVFKAIIPHCSYFNYDLLELLVDVHGSSEDKAHFDEYLQAFTSYCKAMPCAEEVCGNGDSATKQTKLKFKTNFDRQHLKPNTLRGVKCNIANHLKISPSALYLKSIEEGCLSLVFLIPSFLFGRIFPLSDEQKVALYNEVKVISIHCEELFVVCIHLAIASHAMHSNVQIYAMVQGCMSTYLTVFQICDNIQAVREVAKLCA